MAETHSKKKMLVICPFPEGLAPAQRLKYEQYFDDWRREGYQVDVSPFTDPKVYPVLWERGYLLEKAWGAIKGTLRRFRDVLRIPQYDLVYVFLWVTPLGPPFAEWLVRRLSKRLIYDIDDNVHLGQNLASQYDPNPILKLIKGKNKPLFMMRTADYVICSSPFLEKEAREINSRGNAVYITSSVDTDYFTPRPDVGRTGPPVVGWTGTFSSRPFLDMLQPALAKLGETRDFEFRVVGNFDYQMEGVNLKVVRFDKATEVEDLRHFDIGVYPLPNDPWVLGKSGLKAIVYMSMGLPVVASAVGTTPLLYEHGEIGYMVDETDEAWVEALTKLIDDAELRGRMGAEARRVAIENYSRQAVLGQYLEILNQTPA